MNQTSSRTNRSSGATERKTVVAGRELARTEMEPMRPPRNSPAGERRRTLIISLHTWHSVPPSLNFYVEFSGGSGEREYRWVGRVRQPAALQIATAMTLAAGELEAAIAAMNASTDGRQ